MAKRRNKNFVGKVSELGLLNQ